MATIAVNNKINQGVAQSVFPSIKNFLSSAVSYNQGDLIAFDTSTKLVKAVTATADAAHFLGVAINTVVNGKIKSPYIGTAVDASAAFEEVAGPEYGCVFKLKAKTGDAFVKGDLVYLTTVDAQTVTVTDPGDGLYIGVYLGGAIASAAAGQLIEVMIKQRYL